MALRIGEKPSKKNGPQKIRMPQNKSCGIIIFYMCILVIDYHLYRYYAMQLEHSYNIICTILVLESQKDEPFPAQPKKYMKRLRCPKMCLVHTRGTAEEICQMVLLLFPMGRDI